MGSERHRSCAPRVEAGPRAHARIDSLDRFRTGGTPLSVDPDHVGPDVDLERLYDDLVLVGASGSPGVTLHLVTSINGAATGPDGRSGSLGGEADRLALRRLRDGADVVLAGGGTVRDEAYGPIGSDPERQARRLAKGLTPRPRLAVLTNEGVDTRRLRGDDDPPLVVTSNANLEGDPEADVVVLGAPVEPRDLVRALDDRGLARILCEGGPRLAQWMLAAGVVEELFLTVAPNLVDGQRRLFADPVPTTELELVSVLHHDNDVLLRYRLHG